MTDAGFLNNIDYNVMDRLASFQVFYMEACGIIAAICFMMALGMAVVKISLGACNPKEEFFNLFMSLIYYWIMIAAYPTAMKAILPFAMNMGYGAVFNSGAYTVDVYEGEVPDGNGGKTRTSKANFYKWLTEKSGGYFTVSEDEDDETGAVRQALNLNLVDSNTGRFDINRAFRFVMVFGNVVFSVLIETLKSLISASGLWKIGGIGTLLLWGPHFFLLATIMFVVGVFCYILTLIQYVTCLVDYYALMGFGILMVPLSLWQGTKSYTQGLLGAIGKITIKLIVISSIMFLTIMTYVDMFGSLYVLLVGIQLDASQGAIATLKGFIECTLTVVFISIFVYIVAQNTSAIAGFLSGGNPSLSVGEFGRAVAATAGSTAAGAAAGKAVAGAARGVENFAGSVVSGAVGGGIAGALVGGTVGSAVKSAVSTAGHNAGGKLAGAALNAPKAVGEAAKGLSSQSGNIAAGLGLQGSLSQEGVSFFGKGRGSSAGGGGSSGGGSDSSSGGESSSSQKGSPDTNESKEQGQVQGGVRSATEGKGSGGGAGKLSQASSSKGGASASSSGGGGKVDNSSGTARADESDLNLGLTGAAGDVDPHNALPEHGVDGRKGLDEMGKADYLSDLGDSLSGAKGSGTVASSVDHIRQAANRAMHSGDVRKAIGGALVAGALNAPGRIRQAAKAARIAAKGKNRTAEEREWQKKNGFKAMAKNDAASFASAATKGLDGNGSRVSLTMAGLRNAVEGRIDKDTGVRDPETRTATREMVSMMENGRTYFAGNDYSTGEKRRDFRVISDTPYSGEVSQAPKDSDAVNMAREATREAVRSESKGPLHPVAPLNNSFTVRIVGTPGSRHPFEDLYNRKK